MTLPKKLIGLLGVIHVLLVAYSILAVTIFVAVRTPPARGELVEVMQSYGFLLFLVPLAWTLVTAFFLSKSPPPRHAASLSLSVWGLATAVLLTLDIALTFGAVEKDVESAAEAHTDLLQK